MKITRVLPLLIAAACGPAVEHADVTPVPPSVNTGAATITPGDVRARISFLASDALRGRDTPSQGLEAAAAYVASEFQRLGLEPHGDDGGWLQRYPYPVRSLIGDSTQLTISTRGETHSFVFGRDVFVWPGSQGSASGELAFYGTSLPDGPAVGERLPVVYIGGRLDRAWRTAAIAARNAARRLGANALIVVLDSAITPAEIAQRAAIYSTTSNVSPVASTIFVAYDAARSAFRSAGQDLDALVRRSATATIQPVVLASARARIDAPVSEVTYHPPNVVGILRGSDPALRNTYVVMSAHMDHIGVTRPDARGDSINNGADDDASGTTAVIEVAEAFASLPTRPARSILFLTVSGEEKGLLGSEYFTDHPTVPIDSIVADINIDMISRNAPDTVVAIGQEYTSLGPLTAEVVADHPELGLTLSRDIWPEERFFFRSDHYNFAKHDVPAIFFFSGVHEDYHRPSDEVSKIDANKAARIARLAYYLANEIATRPVPPAWTEQGLQEVRSLTR